MDGSTLRNWDVNIDFESLFDELWRLLKLNGALRAHELILVFYRRLPTYNKIPLENQKGKPYQKGGAKTRTTPIYHTTNMNSCGSTDGTRCPRDVIKFSRDKKHWGHPTQKPEALMQYTQPGEVILDPFAGSGATLAAAQATGRRAIGCELDPTFCDIICRRCGLTRYGEDGAIAA